MRSYAWKQNDFDTQWQAPIRAVASVLTDEWQSVKQVRDRLGWSLAQTSATLKICEVKGLVQVRYTPRRLNGQLRPDYRRLFAGNEASA